jgi:hypothetical protein
VREWAVLNAWIIKRQKYHNPRIRAAYERIVKRAVDVVAAKKPSRPDIDRVLDFTLAR